MRLTAHVAISIIVLVFVSFPNATLPTQGSPTCVPEVYYMNGDKYDDYGAAHSKAQQILSHVGEGLDELLRRIPSDSDYVVFSSSDGGVNSVVSDYYYVAWINGGNFVFTPMPLFVTLPQPGLYKANTTGEAYVCKEHPNELIVMVNWDGITMGVQCTDSGMHPVESVKVYNQTLTVPKTHNGSFAIPEGFDKKFGVACKVLLGGRDDCKTIVRGSTLDTRYFWNYTKYGHVMRNPKLNPSSSPRATVRRTSRTPIEPSAAGSAFATILDRRCGVVEIGLKTPASSVKISDVKRMGCLLYKAQPSWWSNLSSNLSSYLPHYFR